MAPASESGVARLLLRMDQVVRTPWREMRLGASSKPAVVELPTDARSAARLVDHESNVAIAFRVMGADPVAAVSTAELEVYPKALGGTSPLIHRASSSGTEDFVFLEEKPAREELRYHVELAAGVAGLRLIADTLEFLDDHGVPRLRMAAPWVQTSRASGSRRIDANVAVEGCAYDTSATDPRRRKPTPPGASACEVVVSWGNQNVEYPALVDPAWSTTGKQAAAHGAPIVRLNDGRIITCCGVGITGSKTTEIYDPSTGTWAMSASTLQNHTLHTLTVLDDGRVLVVGGNGGAPGFAAEVLNLAAPTPVWTSAGTLTTARTNHTATKLFDGRVLVAGGSNAPDSEIYDPALNSWSFAGTNAVTRTSATAQRLPDGRVFLAGGSSAGNGAASSEIFDPNASGTPWTQTSSFMFYLRSTPSSVLVDDKIIVTGGATTNDVDIYDLSLNNWFQGPKLPWSVNTTRVVHLNGSRVLAYDNMSRAAIYEPTAPGGPNWWSIIGQGLPIRSPAVLLANGKVLLTGSDTTADAWLFDETMAEFDGGACLETGNCKSGNCKEGFCCNTACTGTCVACRNSQTGLQNGKCNPASAGTDPYDSCLDEGSPTCNLNGACDGAGACQKYPASTTCTPKACTLGTQCASGFCVDGICCDSACTGKCTACTTALKGQGPNGVCGFIVANTDPNNECPGTVGTGACFGINLCDGAGACQTQAAGNVCQPASCQSTDTQVNASTCDQAGACVSNGTTSCSPYLCSGNTCLTTCTSQAQCALGTQCIGGQCITLKANGLPCAAPLECQSTLCVEGVCCDTLCDGECDSCNAANKAGGSSGTCGPRKSGAACGGAPTCTSSSILTKHQCNGLGTCVADPDSCAPFACASGACLATCSSSTDCTPPAQCVGNACVIVSDAGPPDDASTDDASTNDASTNDGATTEDGSTTEDAAPSEDASIEEDGSSSDDASNTEDAATADAAAGGGKSDSGSKSGGGESADEGGCGCRVPSRSRGNSLWVAAAALALLARRRARRSGTSRSPRS
jgi:hypothetical protein